jgi:hypothetical protein
MMPAARTLAITPSAIGRPLSAGQAACAAASIMMVRSALVDGHNPRACSSSRACSQAVGTRLA